MTTTDPPPGKAWIGGLGTTARCAGCASGDPYDDARWPCETVKALVAAIDGKQFPEACGHRFAVDRREVMVCDRPADHGGYHSYIAKGNQ